MSNTFNFRAFLVGGTGTVQTKKAPSHVCSVVGENGFSSIAAWQDFRSDDLWYKNEMRNYHWKATILFFIFAFKKSLQDLKKQANKTINSPQLHRVWYQVNKQA